MRAILDAFGPVVFALGFLVLLPFTRQALVRVGEARPPMPCECIGPERARLRAVYLHGLDTPGPSWIELTNRTKLRALASELGVRFALPRRGEPWTSHRSVEKETDSLSVIRRAADTCFRGGESYGLIGFSDGGNFVNELVLERRATGAGWAVSIGSEGLLHGMRRDLSGCGRLWLIAGRHEPFFASTRTWARLLARDGAPVRFIEHGGPHELPYEETLMALKEALRTGAP